MVIVETLINVIAIKDKYTAEHSKKVTDISMLIAQRLGLEQQFVDKIGVAASLHDIGKIAVDQTILNKPGPLSAAEYEVVKEHPKYGAEVLEYLPNCLDVKDMVKYHHERFDGKGYPYGMKGQDIPLGARIIAVGDAFDAMTSDRPYRKAMAQQIAVGILKQEKSTQFDPDIVDLFVKLLEQAG